MPKLFSYVVDHDHGYAPCPDNGFCTLARCKFGGEKKNIVETAEIGDWVAGTGGLSKESAGHGRLIYVMRVDEKMTWNAYYRDKRFQGRVDNGYSDSNDKFVLISKHFFYFGKNAIEIDNIPKKYLDHSFEKKGQGYRKDFSDKFIKEFTEWLEKNYRPGKNGDPCSPLNSKDCQCSKNKCS